VLNEKEENEERNEQEQLPARRGERDLNSAFEKLFLDPHGGLLLLFQYRNWVVYCLKSC
jgi:hypothetical protein